MDLTLSTAFAALVLLVKVTCLLARRARRVVSPAARVGRLATPGVARGAGRPSCAAGCRRLGAASAPGAPACARGLTPRRPSRRSPTIRAASARPLRRPRRFPAHPTPLDGLGGRSPARAPVRPRHDAHRRAGPSSRSASRCTSPTAPGPSAGSCSRARPLDDPAWQTPLYEIADRLELDAAPRLLRSDDVKMPFAAGLLILNHRAAGARATAGARSGAAPC